MLAERIAASLIDDGGRSVVLRGPAGIGKSHTARQVAELLEGRGPQAGVGADGVSVRRLAGGGALRTIPFGALMPLLPPDADPVGVEFELVQRLRASMVPQGVGRRVVVIDDVDLLDEKSAGLVEMLVRQGDVCVVATERTPLTGPPTEHALTHALRDEADVVEVPPMSDEELGELIVEWEGPAEEGSIRRLVAVSRGNPLVARELLEAARAASAIVRRGALWHLGDFPMHGHTIERLVGEHLARLQPPEWRLVRCAAVAGALPRSLAERIDAPSMSRLERAGLLIGTPLELGHPLYGEVTRAAMTLDERRDICRTLLTTVEPGDHVDEGRLGSWLLCAGDVVDLGIARAGARRALARWENQLARDLLLTVPEPSVGDLVMLQWAAANAGHLDEARRWADLAVEQAEAGGDDLERVEAVLARSELLCLQMNSADEGRGALVALRAALTDTELVARVDGAIALYSHMTGNRELATEAVGRVRPSDGALDLPAESSARVAVLLGDAFSSVFSGRFSSADEVIAEGRSLADRLDERHNVVRFDITDTLRLLFTGDLGGANALVDAALQRADVAGVRPANVAWLGLAAQLAQLEGRFDVAERRDREAVRMADHVDDLGAGGFVRGDLCAMAAEFGRDVDIDPRSSPIGLARLQVRLAPVDEADALAEQLASMTADAGYVLWAPWVAREAVRRGPAPRAAALLEQYAATVEGPLVAAMATHATGMLAGDLEQVEAAARSFLEHRCTMPAIDAGLDAMTLALRHGPSVPLRRAVLEFSRVIALVTPAPPPKLVARHDELIEAAELPSARQLQIAKLAASGRSSKEIAGELHLSARTVDNHLAAVYRSLGVSSRDELDLLTLP